MAIERDIVVEDTILESALAMPLSWQLSALGCIESLREKSEAHDRMTQEFRDALREITRRADASLNQIEAQSELRAKNSRRLQARLKDALEKELYALPAHRRQDALRLIEGLHEKRKNWVKTVNGLRGSVEPFLNDDGTPYTSVELQRKVSDWWGEMVDDNKF